MTWHRCGHCGVTHGDVVNDGVGYICINVDRCCRWLEEGPVNDYENHALHLELAAAFDTRPNSDVVNTHAKVKLRGGGNTDSQGTASSDEKRPHVHPEDNSGVRAKRKRSRKPRI